MRTGCADRRSGGQGKRPVGLGNGSPDIRSGLAVSPAEQPVRLGGKAPDAAEAGGATPQPRSSAGGGGGAVRVMFG
jgi:hypothetical protein